MDINVEKFVKDYNRMCGAYRSNGCCGCPVNADNNTRNTCNHIEVLEFIVPIVQKWVEEHPAKTYLMDFKEKFPNSRVDDIAKRFCLKNYYGEKAGFRSSACNDCRGCWNREME